MREFTTSSQNTFTLADLSQANQCQVLEKVTKCGRAGFSRLKGILQKQVGKNPRVRFLKTLRKQESGRSSDPQAGKSPPYAEYSCRGMR
jgi:hypothetical protein